MGAAEFWIDVGGTFTDCIQRQSDGRLRYAKVLSSGIVKGQVAEGSSAAKVLDPDRQEPQGFFGGYELRLRLAGEWHCAKVVASEAGCLQVHPLLPVAPPVGSRYELCSGEPAPVLGIRTLLSAPLTEELQGIRIRLGTTRGTNALLERKGARTALVTTAGFGDVLAIGTQARPHLFELQVRKPEPLYTRVREVTERVDSQGGILVPLDEEQARAVLAELVAEGIDAVAIVLINAYANDRHERRLAELAAEAGFRDVSASAVLSPTIKVVDRGDTAVVDAYLSPVIRDYLAAIRDCLPGCDLRLMTSAGGLVSADRFCAKDSILSGPAGGVVGFAEVARQAGFEQAIGFDMGGTSTDVSRFGGRYEYQFSTEKAGVRIVAPMYAIETVAAGGGSICGFDGQRLTIGPESAGAAPGPACYGSGGPLTVTDINLFLGRIDEPQFPFPLDRQAVEESLRQRTAEIASATGTRYSLVELAKGYQTLANRKMAEAITRISTAKGYEPGQHALVAFGGAAAQHATAIADELGIHDVVISPEAGILSAYGIGVADVRRFRQQSVLRPCTAEVQADLEGSFRQLEQELREEVLAEGVAPERIRLQRYLDLRYQGEEHALTIPAGEGGYESGFADEHARLYGHHHDRPVEIATLRVEAIGESVKPALSAEQEHNHTPDPSRTRQALLGEDWGELPIYQRAELQAGARLTGPAMITDAFCTILVDPGWGARRLGNGYLLLQRQDALRQVTSGSVERDPLRLELFNSQFTHIAEEMGLALQRTALSVNVKERLDFSCAILDGDGNLVVNAPHIPVHLGAMSECVQALLRQVDDLRPGDVYLTNDPNLGGSHLPDLTVMSPVFSPAGDELRFVVASRAHHAEIGGLRPGSTYPFAENLAEEGVVFRHLLLQRDGCFREDELRRALTEAPYPSRSPDENVADLRAAIAANRLGGRELHALTDLQGWPVVRAYMGHIRAAAEEKTRAAIAALPDGTCELADALDDDSPIQVKVTIDGERLQVDFTGSAPVHPLSLNANRAIVRSALLYCLRCLLAEDIPLNSGVFAPLELILPEGLLNPPVHEDPTQCAAVVGGNVELSQRVVDVVLGALGLAAASQGTMNNFVFGNDRFGYYETICGGTGAGPGFPGADAVHSHMTNTRLTDVEVLEHRYPVRVRAFAIRRGSGGAGKWPGGDGLIRELEFLEPLTVSLLTQRRRRAPFGLEGGGPGKPGRNLLRRGGQETELDALAQLKLLAGDCLRLETPGGGGFGRID